MYSIFEKGNSTRNRLDNAITFGRITNVDTKKRLVTVKTFGPVDDQSLVCQVISADGHPDGDESGSVPRKGTIGLVFFVGGEPFFFGSIKPLDQNATANTKKSKDVKLKEGDKIYSTDAGNYVLIRASGVIEIVSGDMLRTTLSPKDNTHSTFCANYQLLADGGSVKWENQGAPLNQTLYSAEYAADLMRTSIVYEQKGNVSTSLVYQRDVGAGIPGVIGVTVPLYTESIDRLGTYKRGLGPNALIFQETYNPDGSFELKNLAYTLKVSELGAIDVSNQFYTCTISESGDIDVTNPLVTVKAAATGDFSVKNKTVSIEATSSGELTIDASKAKITMGKGKFEITGIAGGLMETLIEVAQTLIDLTTSMAAEVHVGNLGYPTAPPTNAPDYVKATASLTKLKTIMETLKK